MPEKGAATRVCRSSPSWRAICFCRISFCRFAAAMLLAVERRVSSIS
jgi:hypothetical protein